MYRKNIFSVLCPKISSRDHNETKYRVDFQRGIFFVRTFVPPGVSLGPVFVIWNN